MKFTGVSLTVRTALLFALLTPCLALLSQAQTETILYSFSGGANGFNSLASLLFDSAGNLYGTASEGGNTVNCGSSGCGVVFQLSPSSAGWTQSVLYSFLGGRTDGANPFAGLISDGAGNLYGTTGNGGTTGLGYGLIFKLSPNGSGGWNETILHKFVDNIDGANPYGTLLMDAAGNLFGTAHGGGDPHCGSGCGVVFEFSPNATGGWRETLLHSFTGGNDGYHPSAGLISDAAGNLYGTASQGGANNGSGVVFRLSNSSGHWQYRVLHTFHNSDGQFPATPLVMDGSGNLFGTTSAGGNLNQCIHSGCGVVFELTPTSTGGWKETLVHTFQDGLDGAIPSGLIFDNAGNLYGTTEQGGNTSLCRGNADGCGVAFELSPSSGRWIETVLHTFDPNATPGDGMEPQAGLIFDSAGNLYGTTPIGGANGFGTVFEISK